MRERLKWTGILTALLCLTGCTTLFYQPTPYLYVHPKQLNMEKIDHFFDSKDGTELHGWEFKSKTVAPPKFYLLFFHGNAQNITAHYLNFHWLPDRGGSFFIPDYRGYGLSEEVSPNQQGVHKDALASLEYGLELAKNSGAKKLVVYAQSLSGQVIMRALEDFEQREKIDLLVLDSTYPSYQRIAREKVEGVKLLWPLWPFVEFLISDEYAAEEFYRVNKRPTLVVHGKKDRVVPFHWGKEVFERLETPRKWFWKIQNGHHSDIFRSKGHGKKYRNRFMDFVQEL